MVQIHLSAYNNAQYVNRALSLKLLLCSCVTEVGPEQPPQQSKGLNLIIRFMLILASHLNTSKALLFSLQAIYGVNTATALKICGIVGVCPKVKLNKLNANQLDKLTKTCREQLNTNVFKQKLNNIKFLIHIRHVKGFRHMFGLPSRGQRTRTNAKTSKKIMAKLRLNLTINNKNKTFQ